MSMSQDLSDNFDYRRGYRDAESFTDPRLPTDQSRAFMYDLGYSDGGGEQPLAFGNDNPKQSLRASKHRLIEAQRAEAQLRLMLLLKNTENLEVQL